MGSGRGVEEFELSDAESAVPDLVGSQVGRNEEVRFIAALFEPVLRAQEAEFFLDGGEEDEIASCVLIGALERAEGFESRHEVGGIVANAGRAQDVANAFYFHVGTFGEDRIRVGGDDDCRPAAGTFANAAYIEDVIGADVGETELFHFGADVLGTGLLLAGGGRDFDDLNPFIDDGGGAVVDGFEGGGDLGF